MIRVIKITDSFAQIEVKGVRITFTEPYQTVKDKYPLAETFIDKCIAHALCIYNETRVNPISNPPLPIPELTRWDYLDYMDNGQVVSDYRKDGYITGSSDAVRVSKPLYAGVIS
jgi:hypothetical protein